MDTVPKDRAEAKRCGASHYFTGAPCKHGHVALRKVSGKCVQCVKEEAVALAPSRKSYFDAYNRSEKGRELKKDYYERNTDVVKARANARPTEDKNRYRLAWRAANKDLVTADNRNRKRRHREATPPWVTLAQRNEMRALYRVAMQLTRTTGVPYVVDHIVPLRSPVVCGLHVPWNLQVMTRDDNLKKSNKHV